MFFSVSKSLMRHEYRCEMGSASVRLFFSLFEHSLDFEVQHTKRIKSPSQRMVQATLWNLSDPIDNSLNTGNHVLCLSWCFIVCQSTVQFGKDLYSTLSTLLHEGDVCFMPLPSLIWHLKSPKQTHEKLHCTYSPDDVSRVTQGPGAPRFLGRSSLTKRFDIGSIDKPRTNFEVRAWMEWESKMQVGVASYDQPWSAMLIGRVSGYPSKTLWYSMVTFFEHWSRSRWGLKVREKRWRIWLIMFDRWWLYWL